MSLENFEKKLLDSFPLDQWVKRRVCLAVSGGADSVASLCAFARIARQAGASENLFVVTVDHRSRGEESDEDVLFVKDLSARYRLEFFARQIDPVELLKESRRQGSWESAARILRYRLLIETAKQNGARFLVTAHHNDDQLETLLFRIFRGSGLDGLRGIAPRRVIDDSIVIIRPLLGVSREDICNYLTSLNQFFRSDSSNASPLFARNRIRNELIPILEKIFPGKWRKSLLRLAQIANDTEFFIDKLVDDLEQTIKVEQDKQEAYCEALNKLQAVPILNNKVSIDAVEIPRSPIQNVAEEVAIRFFRKVWKEKKWALGKMGSEEWRRLTRTARTGTTTRQFPDSVFISFPNESTIRLERKPKSGREFQRKSPPVAFNTLPDVVRESSDIK